MHEKPFHVRRIILLKIQNFTEETDFADERKIIFRTPGIEKNAAMMIYKI
jgi:hypothetical protein